MEPAERFGRIADELGASLVGYEQLLGGSSADVWRLDVDDSSGNTRHVVYRRHKQGLLQNHDATIVRKEYRVLELLWARGMPVAEPLLLIGAEHTVITSWVRGSTLVAPHALPSAIDQMVDFLIELHGRGLGAQAADVLAVSDDPIATLPGYLPATPAGARLGAALESGTIPPPSNDPVLLHGDYWPGNFLWHGGRLAAVIDWEDACLGDPLADLACARVELLCQYGEAAMDRFSRGYLDRSPGLDTASLPLWECYVSATALASMHLWTLTAAEESRRRSLTETFFARAVDDLLSLS